MPAPLPQWATLSELRAAFKAHGYVPNGYRTMSKPGMKDVHLIGPVRAGAPVTKKEPASVGKYTWGYT